MVSPLEDHLVRPAVPREPELCLEVCLHVRGGVDGSHEGGINLFLEGLPLCGNLDRDGLSCREERLLIFSLCTLLALEVAVLDVGSGGGGRCIDLRGSGYNVGLVHTPEGHAIDFERSSDKKKPRWHLLEENNALALVPSGEEDKDSSRRDRGAQLGGPRGEVPGNARLDVIRGVEIRGLHLILRGEARLGADGPLSSS